MHAVTGPKLDNPNGRPSDDQGSQTGRRTTLLRRPWLVYRDYDVIVHLTGYEYETFGETLWAVGAEVVKELEIVVPVSVDQTQHYRSYDEALAHGTTLGKWLVDGL